MSSTYIFIAGSFVFAGTVWGSVMVGGVALGLRMNRDRDEQPETTAREQD